VICPSGQFAAANGADLICHGGQISWADGASAKARTHRSSLIGAGFTNVGHTQKAQEKPPGGGSQFQGPRSIIGRSSRL
jgi:hypothetical protein